MKIFYFLAMTMLATVTTSVAQPAKPPEGKRPTLHCATFDKRCESALLAKLKSNPQTAKTAPSIITALKAEYAKGRRGHPQPAELPRYWWCIWSFPYVLQCVGEEGVDFYIG